MYLFESICMFVCVVKYDDPLFNIRLEFDYEFCIDFNKLSLIRSEFGQTIWIALDADVNVQF